MYLEDLARLSTQSEISTIQEESLNEQQEASAEQQELLIPENSPTLLLDESTTRFSGAEWFNEIQRQNIILAGIGGIGSWVALQLARMCPASLFMYDDDTVETVNMAGQLYARDDIGKLKVSAMNGMISRYTNMQNIYSINDRFTENTEAGNIMICGFDNMAARKVFFTKWRDHVTSKDPEERCNCLFIDGRLSAEVLQVYCFTGDNSLAQQKYAEECLFSDNQADETVCSYKQTTYMANMIGSIIVNLFTNFVANEVAGAPIRELPFFTTYDGYSMQLKIE